MSALLRAAAVALVGHAAMWIVAWLTSAAAERELSARGVALSDPESLIEMFVQDGLWATPVRVVVAGLAASLFLTPFLEAALAAAAAGARSLREALHAAVRLTPASLGVSLVLTTVAALALALASFLPYGVHRVTGQIFDDRVRATWIAIAAIPGLGLALGCGVSVDAGRVHLALGATPADAIVRGLRAVASRLFPVYALTLAFGLAAAAAHAWLGRNDDASALVAGGVVLLARPLSRALFMWLAAREGRRR